MKRILLLMATLALAAAAVQQANAGVSVDIRIGGHAIFAPPVCAYPQPTYWAPPPPLVITPPPISFHPAPVVVCAPPVVVRPAPVCIVPPRPIISFYFGLGHHHRPLHRVCWQ